MEGLIYWEFFCLFTKLRLVTINVEGLQSPLKRTQVFQSFIDFGVDVVALQETHCDANVIETWKSEWPGPSCWTTYRSNSAGVAFLFHPTPDTRILDTKSDPNGRLLRVLVEINGTVLQLFNVYGPNPESIPCS